MGLGHVKIVDWVLHHELVELRVRPCARTVAGGGCALPRLALQRRCRDLLGRLRRAADLSKPNTCDRNEHKYTKTSHMHLRLIAITCACA